VTRRASFIVAAIVFTLLALGLLLPPPGGSGGGDATVEPGSSRTLPPVAGASPSPTPAVERVTIAGLVEDATNHRPVAGARVRVFHGWTETAPAAETVSAADGRFALDADPPAIARASSPGYVEASARCEPGAPCTLVLARGVTVRGRVVRATDGTGVPDASVVCRSAIDSSATALSGIAGDFELDGCAPGAILVSARHPEAGTGSALLAERVSDELVDHVSIPLSPSPLSLHGRVLDAGSPAGDAWIAALPGAAPGRRAMLADAPAHPDGTFDLLLPKGAWHLYAVAADGRIAEAQIALASSSLSLELALPPSKSIAGVVTAGGRPAAGVAVIVAQALGRGETPSPGEVEAQDVASRLRAFRGVPSPAGAVTAEDGTFRLTGLADEIYRIEATDDAGGRGSALVPAGSRSVQIELVAGGVLAGSVTDAAGAPANGVLFAVAPGSEERIPVDAGEFEMKGLAPGDYQLVAHTDHGVSDPVHAKVIAGEVTTVDVRLPAAAGATILGRLVGEGGLPVPSARVEATQWSEIGGTEHTSSHDGGLTDAGGVFRVSGVRGRVFLTFHHPDYRPASLSVEVGPGGADVGDVTLTLAR
jgi:hypothetical protein